MSTYQGTFHEDGIQALIDAVHRWNGITILEIAPAPNLQIALKKDPSIASKAHIKSMGGSIRIGYNGKPPASPEYNIHDDIPAAMAMYEAAWPIQAAPLDTTVQSTISGTSYQVIRDSPSIYSKTLLECYRWWWDHCSWRYGNPESASTILFDLVAAYTVITDEGLLVTDLNIKVNDQGMTEISSQGRLVREGMQWRSDGLNLWTTAVVKILGK
eukprot:TRINITY_DN1742_c0_g1_i2.p1 TRINITY_DN1742_c0_g1~~TRINITY_DN1742_c0_g1_i2.p1  ORF type:complete len:214 (-),score=52.57 TRINITY_DN1742_c0_g1_i2:43-684(-)